MSGCPVCGTPGEDLEVPDAERVDEVCARCRPIVPTHQPTRLYVQPRGGRRPIPHRPIPHQPPPPEPN